MTIAEVIAGVDKLKPNCFDTVDKIRWLSELDGRIKSEIIDTHEGSDESGFIGYGEDADISTPLLVSFPYDDIYIRYLEMQIDYSNGETAKYTNSSTLFNEAYSAYMRYYNRTHMPKRKKSKYF